MPALLILSVFALYFGRDANRLAFVLAGVLTWVTLPLYVLLVLILPEEETGREAAPAVPAAPTGPVEPPPPPDIPSEADQGPENAGR